MAHYMPICRRGRRGARDASPGLELVSCGVHEPWSISLHCGNLTTILQLHNKYIATYITSPLLLAGVRAVRMEEYGIVSFLFGTSHPLRGTSFFLRINSCYVGCYVDCYVVAT